MIQLNEILQKFNVDSTISEYGNGHINDTYCTEKPRFILQKINVNVFKNPDELMENIVNVTDFLKKKIIQNYGNPERETLTVLRTLDGGYCYKADKENVFRLYKFIDDTITIENSKTAKDLYQAGKGFGKFQRMLDDFPVEKLHETIKDFHDTPKRVEQLKKAIEEDRAGRASLVSEEIDFALKNAAFADKVVKGIESGTIPLRVTHNDTKINNILFDKFGGEAICVIDLDTVMPGSMLYDFGDALRMGGSTAAEDETDLSKVHFDKECFTAFAKGFLKEVKDIVTPAEKELFAFSVKLMTYECGIRFLADYLNGDTYFKIHRENHNLDRARNQFALVDELNRIEPELNGIIKELS